MSILNPLHLLFVCILLVLPFRLCAEDVSIPILQQNGTLLQDLVTWDQHSISIRGERLLLLSAEFHPFRLPSPGLWLDIFQKVKAIGYNTVSFYVDWALIEGRPGDPRLEGIFDLDSFFAAASEAGIYLIARPGPYINSELSGGGLPGWLQRIKAEVRSTSPEYLNATEAYMAAVGAKIARAQITNGGPIILFQPENEYSLAVGAPSYIDSVKLLEPTYMEYVEQQARRNGIVVPLVSNDMVPLGNWAPGTGIGEADIYAHDSYPFYDGCGNPTNWSNPTKLVSLDYTYQNHLQQSPTTPYSVLEFQGGAPDPWGGVGLEKCAALIGPEFQRVFQKELFGRSIKLLNIYMTYGGTNWGNMGHPEGYTSYDYGAMIAEDRSLRREKYSEAKLQAQFLQASPAYLTAIPENKTHAYVNTDELLVTPVGNKPTRFYLVRHTDWTSWDATPYRLTVPTSIGNLTIPQLGGNLTLNGRDSKIHVTDYDIGGINLIYSSAEIFTWKKYGERRVLLLYGGENELHEFALPTTAGNYSSDGDGVTVQQKGSMTVVRWQVERNRRIVKFANGLEVYLLWRNDAYNYWILELPAPLPIGNYSSTKKTSVIAKAGYLLRSAHVSKGSLHLTGDINSTTDLEIISGVDPNCSLITFNGQPASNFSLEGGRLHTTIKYREPDFSLPDLRSLDWKYIDSLPEITSTYDDAEWAKCSLSESNNPRNLTTPTSLYAGDYGFHAGSLIYRGHFVASGIESQFNLTTQGGAAYGHSLWINDTFLGSFAGDGHSANHSQSFNFPTLEPGKLYIFTLVMDHMGLNMNSFIHSDSMKEPRGILHFSLSNRPQSDIAWSITGNLGGENYIDTVRGPLNEGAMYAERQGYHQPGPPSASWPAGSPFEGIPEAGIGFFTATFGLDLPSSDYDIPLSIVLSNATTEDGTPAKFRCQIFVNGYQFGKYINNVGPQTSFPVPEGVLNYNGQNTLALTLWALEDVVAKLDGIRIVATEVVQSGYSAPCSVMQPRWEKRDGAY
ncbi:Glycosyl hydrolase family 35 [Lasiodiplodia theobromae]|uniref:Glycosyl hydrolase family 35 n=1 Tax=Lasiodiplodia theobromae TaxID=45133 RepID=UPI0015C3E1AA|nr:Glycosyl hydrolase family 35 [Lasiodiplodia theobromae]KAF4539570.1 Glycosyl hydrolase family 35 [Lasiodiplodia theobromae]